MASIFDNWNKKIYIATLKETRKDEFFNDINEYNEPKAYMMNVMPASGSLDSSLYGENIKSMYKAIVPYAKYKDMFHEGDIAYLEGATPVDEIQNGANANYEITSVRPQNLMIAIYFTKKHLGGQINDI